MPYTLPENWVEYGSNGTDSVTFLRPGHTVAEPRLAIFNRKAPVMNGQGFSVPTYRIRLIDGHVDSEGFSLKEKTILDLTIRHPVNASLTTAEGTMAALATMLSDAELVDDALVNFMFPREAAPVA